jgi:TrmH family RNA methyltransferase
MPPTITSRSNPWFRRFRDAIELHGEEIVLEGPKQIADAMALGWEPIAVLRSEPDASPGDHLVSPALLRSLSETMHSQGVLALFPRPQTSAEAILRDASAPVMILDGVQDPGNVGTIIRLAAAFEAAGVLLTEGCADPYGPKAIRASAGTLLLVPVARSSREEIVRLCRELEVPSFAAVAGGAARPLPPGRSALVLGSEGQGVSVEMRAAAQPISIGTSAKVESLNVAAAAAILLHAAWNRRQR